MSKQYPNPRFPLNVTVCIGAEVYAGRRWEGVDKAVADITDVYKVWMYRRPYERERAWYCPVCTAVGYGEPQETPKCPRHRIEMRRYDEEEFAKRRRELAEAAVRDLKTVLPLFVKVIETYGGRPAEWRFEDGVVVVKPDDPTELRYEDGAIRAFFYRCDSERSCNAAKLLLEEAARLGLKVSGGYMLHFNPPCITTEVCTSTKHE
jgi:hypothetical protein